MPPEKLDPGDDDPGTPDHYVERLESGVLTALVKATRPYSGRRVSLEVIAYIVAAFVGLRAFFHPVTLFTLANTRTSS
jgi:hypothetical protein